MKTMEQTIQNYIKAQLLDNYYGAIGYSYKEWLKVSAENEPGFFAYLFNASGEDSIDSINDLSDRQRESWEEFLNEVDNLTVGDYINHFDSDTADETLLYPVRRDGDYYWITGAELEEMWDEPAIRVWDRDVFNENRWEERGGDNVDMEKDFEWIKVGTGLYIGIW